MLKLKEKMKGAKEKWKTERDEKRKQREADKERKAEEWAKNAKERVKKAEVKVQKAAEKTGCEEKGRWGTKSGTILLKEEQKKWIGDTAQWRYELCWP